MTLHTIGIVQRNPARAGLQTAPALGRAGAVLDLHDGEHPSPGKLPGLGGVRSGTSADVEVSDRDLYQERHICGRNRPASGGEDGFKDGENLLPVARASGPSITQLVRIC